MRRLCTSLAVLGLALGLACTSNSRADPDTGKYDKAKYCGAVGPTVHGAVDDEGRPLDEFGPKERLRSYLRLAKLAPPSLRDDWEEIGAMVSGNVALGKVSTSEVEKELNAEHHVISNVKKLCGFTINSF